MIPKVEANSAEFTSASLEILTFSFYLPLLPKFKRQKNFFSKMRESRAFLSARVARGGCSIFFYIAVTKLSVENAIISSCNMRFFAFSVFARALSAVLFDIAAG